MLDRYVGHDYVCTLQDKRSRGGIIKLLFAVGSIVLSYEVHL